MPLAVTPGPDGAVFVADGGAGAIVRVEASGGCRVIGERALVRPTGVAFVAGAIYAVDPPAHAIVSFTPDGRERLRFGARGDAAGAELNFPTGLGRMFVSDAQNDVVVAYAPDGAYQWFLGGSGSGPGDLTLPAGVAVAGRFLYVADSYNRRVQIYELLEAAP
jgi:DNA-binding beta-propeller fold protein YncE